MIYVYDTITKKVHIFPNISKTAQALKVAWNTINYRLTHDVDHLKIRKK